MTKKQKIIEIFTKSPYLKDSEAAVMVKSTRDYVRDVRRAAGFHKTRGFNGGRASVYKDKIMSIESRGELTYVEIARIVGCHPETAGRICKEYSPSKWLSRKWA
jgi:hypothetical protein